MPFAGPIIRNNYCGLKCPLTAEAVWKPERPIVEQKILPRSET